MTTNRNILEETADAYAELRSDPERWQEELDERAEWDVTLADGLEDDSMTTPTTTAQATVLSEPVATPSETGFTVTLSTETWDRHIKHYRALTEQVRVLRECVEWYADPTNYRDEDVAAYGYRARRALAALEGSGDQP